MHKIFYNKYINQYNKQTFEHFIVNDIVHLNNQKKKTTQTTCASEFTVRIAHIERYFIPILCELMNAITFFTRLPFKLFIFNVSI